MPPLVCHAFRYYISLFDVYTMMLPDAFSGQLATTFCFRATSFSAGHADITLFSPYAISPLPYAMPLDATPLAFDTQL